MPEHYPSPSAGSTMSKSPERETEYGNAHQAHAGSIQELRQLLNILSSRLEPLLRHDDRLQPSGRDGANLVAPSMPFSSGIAQGLHSSTIQVRGLCETVSDLIGRLEV